jgi:hypothetical protein
MKNHSFAPFGSIGISLLLAAALLFCSPLHAEEADRLEPCVLSAASRNPEHPDAAGLEEEISLTIVNGGRLFEEARQRNKDIILFIDGMPLKEVRSSHRAMKGTRDELSFFISHSDGPIALWNHFISTRGTEGLFTRKVSLSAGFDDQAPIPTLVKDDNAFTLILVRETWFITCILLILALLALFLVLVVKSEILRDIGPKPETGRKPYSLSLVQMASWFFVIISSWLMLYVVKHTMNTITDTLVVLMGISAGTGLGGMTIDANRQRQARRSQGFLRDILSDEYGISFHRFQIFAWTLVMVAVFLRQVTAYLEMPEFDSSLLILMGISSGTYLGFKVSEKPGSGKETTA